LSAGAHALPSGLHNLSSGTYGLYGRRRADAVPQRPDGLSESADTLCDRPGPDLLSGTANHLSGRHHNLFRCSHDMLRRASADPMHRDPDSVPADTGTHGLSADADRVPAGSHPLPAAIHALSVRDHGV